MLIFHTAPETFNKDVVERPTFPIPTDLDACRRKQTRVLRAGEVTALIAVSDLGGCHCQRPSDGIQDKRLFQRVIERPTDDIARIQVEHRD